MAIVASPPPPLPLAAEGGPAGALLPARCAPPAAAWREVPVPATCVWPCRPLGPLLGAMLCAPVCPRAAALGVSRRESCQAAGARRGAGAWTVTPRSASLSPAATRITSIRQPAAAFAALGPGSKRGAHSSSALAPRTTGGVLRGCHAARSSHPTGAPAQCAPICGPWRNAHSKHVQYSSSAA